jgi:hypothetical protein
MLLILWITVWSRMTTVSGIGIGIRTTMLMLMRRRRRTMTMRGRGERGMLVPCTRMVMAARRSGGRSAGSTGMTAMGGHWVLPILRGAGRAAMARRMELR